MRGRGSALALLGLAACGSDPVLLVDVKVPDGLAPRQLRAYAYQAPLHDHVRLREQLPALLPGTTRKFALRLLQSTSSQALVTVQAIASEDGCVAAVGNAQMTVDLGAGPGPYQVQITLDRLNLHRCDGDDRQTVMPARPMQQVNAIAVVPTPSGPAVYAVGNKGAVRRWTAQQGFTVINSGTIQDLYGVFGFDEDKSNLWIVGESGTLLKRQPGSNFAPEEVAGMGTNHLRGIDGSNGQVWVVGDKGTVLMNNGGMWTKLPPQASAANLTAVRATSQTVLLAGEGGVVLKRDAMGNTFTGVSGFDAGINLTAIAARGDKFWLVGAGGRIQTWQGGSVSDVMNDKTTEQLNAVWVSEQAVLVAGNKGTLLSCEKGCAPWNPWAGELTAKQSLRAIAGPPGQADLWLAGGEGEVADVLLRTTHP